MPRLPEELLVMIVEHYLAGRRQELIANHESGWRLRQNDWRIIPILQSNKQLHDLVIGRLYERCIFINRHGWIKFLEDPALSKYAMVKELEIRCRVDYPSAWSHVSDRVTAMFMAHMAGIVKRDIDEGIEQMLDPGSLARCRSEPSKGRPQLETLTVLGHSMYQTGDALDL